MATAGDVAKLTFDDTIGPFLIGTMLALFLQGATLYQEIVFLMNSRKTREPHGYILMVACVTVCDILHSAFAINTIWLWIVENYGNPAILALSPWSFTAEPVMTGFMAFVVQLFYAHRIWLVSEKSALGSAIAGIITVVTVAQFAFSAAVTGKIIAYDREFLRFAQWLWGACVWLGLAAAADIIICFSYFHFLGVVSEQMRGPFERSTRSVVKVAIVILATNGLSAAAAVIAVVIFGSFSGTNYHAIAQLCLSKLMTLSLLVALNARNLLADLLGVEAGYFNSFGNKTTCVKHVGGLGLGGAASGDGIYGRAAAQAGFDALAHSKSMRPPGGPGSNVDLAVRGVGGVVYPLSMPGEGTQSSTGSSEKGAQVAFEDALEHGTVGAHNRQPFARTSSDHTVVAPPATHPYNAQAL